MWADSDKTDAKPLVGGCLGQPGGRKARQHQKNLGLRRLSTDANKGSLALVAKTETDADRDSTGYLTIFHVFGNPVPLILRESLDDDGAACVRQSANVDKEAAAAGSHDHAVRKRLSNGRQLIKHLQDCDHVLAGDRTKVFPGPNRHSSFFGEACRFVAGIVNGTAHRAAMESVDEVERCRKPAVSNSK